MPADQIPQNALHKLIEGKRNKGRTRLNWIENINDIGISRANRKWGNGRNKLPSAMEVISS